MKYSFQLTGEEAGYTMTIAFLGILGNLFYTFAVKYVVTSIQFRGQALKLISTFSGGSARLQPMYFEVWK